MTAHKHVLPDPDAAAEACAQRILGLLNEALGGREFATLDFPDLRSMIAAFLEAAPRADLSNATACFGVAGPVADNAASLTNTPWPRRSPTP